jgi:hypothetical protein
MEECAGGEAGLEQRIECCGARGSFGGKAAGDDDAVDAKALGGWSGRFEPAWRLGVGPIAGPRGGFGGWPWSVRLHTYVRGGHARRRDPDA